MKAKLVRDKADTEYTDWPEGTSLRPANSLPGKHMALCLKMHEEAAEIADDATNPVEYADLLETMLELARLNGVPWASIEEALLEKRERVGGLRRGLVYVRDEPKREPWRPLDST